MVLMRMSPNGYIVVTNILPYMVVISVKMCTSVPAVILSMLK